MAPVTTPASREAMLTVRQQLITLLLAQELNAMELSHALGVMEKEVYSHLAHIAQSIGRQGMKLVVTPFTCLACGFTFTGRNRWDRPGRCPKCKQGHIRLASYRIVGS